MFKFISRIPAVCTFASVTAEGGATEAKPTIVLVHGAFEDSSSWNGVVSMLTSSGFTVVAAANPLRGVASDAEYVASLARSIEGPVVPVGHWLAANASHSAFEMSSPTSSVGLAFLVI